MFPNKTVKELKAELKETQDRLREAEHLLFLVAEARTIPDRNNAEFRVRTYRKKYLDAQPNEAVRTE